MSIIEIGCMGVKPDHHVMDVMSAQGQILNKAWSAVVAADGGPRWAYAGVEILDPLRPWGFFAFDSVAQHETFAESFGGEAVKDLPKILSYPVVQKHVSIEPESEPLDAVLSAGMTHVLLAYFPSQISSKESDAVTQLVRQESARHDEQILVSYG
ncbi:hypothetical protein ACN47E_005552 [Coniothyrium glycines]